MTPSPQKHLKRKHVIGIAILGLSLVAAAAYLAPFYVERTLNRQDLGGLFKEATGGAFTSDRLQFKIWPLPHVVVPNGRVTVPDRLTGQWDTARLYPDLSALLTGQMRAGSVVLEAPKFAVQRPLKSGLGPSPDFSPASLPEMKRHLQALWALAGLHLADMSIELRGGDLRLAGVAESPLHFEGVYLALQGERQTMHIELHCGSNVWKALRLSGSLLPETFEGRLQLVVDQFDPTLFKQELTAGGIQWQPRRMNLQARANLEIGFHAALELKAQIPELRLQKSNQTVTVQALSLEASLDHTPRRTRIDAMRIAARQPSLSLDGKALFDTDAPLYHIALTGRELEIAPFRDAALALAGHDEVVVGIFDVLRGGAVPWIRFSTQGPTVEAMGTFRNMGIAGLLEEGRLFIPDAEIDLTHVNGQANIAGGILTGRGLEAHYGRTRGTDGRLWLDLDQDETVPFFVEVDVKADLAPLPSLLAKWVGVPAFQGEMRRIQDISGSAGGVLVLDGRGTDLDVTVDVTQCRFDAAYDRLPAPLSILDGQVQYTRDRIQVLQMRGNIAASTFANLTAHIAFGETPLLQIDTGSARIAADQVFPWLAADGAADALPFQLQSDDGWITLDRLALEGPLRDPRQWTVDTQGEAERIALTSPELPGPFSITSARFRARGTRLQLPEAQIRLADADLTVTDADLQFQEGLPAVGELNVAGRIDKTAGVWLGDYIDLGRPWRLKTPVTVSTATLSWTADGKRTFRGKMTTGGGVQVALDLALKGNRLQHQTVAVEDRDSRAELKVAFQPEHLEIEFDGRIDSATISRMLLEEQASSGRMEGSFQARIDPQHPGRSLASGYLQAYDIDQPLRIPQRHHIEALHLQARDNRVQITPAVVDIDGQTHRLTGSIAIEEDDFLLDLVHTADQVTLSLPQTPSPGTPPPAPEAFSLWDLPLRGRVTSRLGTLTLGEFQWSPFNAVVRIAPGTWSGQIAEAALCGIATSGDFRISPDAISLALTPTAEDESLDTSLTCLLKKSDLIDGRFDLAGRLQTLAPRDRLTRSIQGQMEFNARDGRIYRFNLLSKVLAVVNLTEIFRGKPPDLMKDGLAYNSIAIRVDIANSLCTIDEAVIDGASANIAGQGTIDLASGEADMIVLVAPFKTVDALVSYTPLVGDWLGGTLISIPVKVTGPLSDPKVTPLAPSAVGSSLMNLMKKTIKLPVKMVAPFWENDDDPPP